MVKKKIIGRFKFLSALFILELYKAEVANICLKNGMTERGKKKKTITMQACSRGTQICHLEMQYIVTVDTSEMDAGVLLIFILSGNSRCFPGRSLRGRERLPRAPALPVLSCLTLNQSLQHSELLFLCLERLVSILQEIDLGVKA